MFDSSHKNAINSSSSMKPCLWGLVRTPHTWRRARPVSMHRATRDCSCSCRGRSEREPAWLHPTHILPDIKASDDEADAQCVPAPPLGGDRHRLYARQTTGAFGPEQPRGKAVSFRVLRLAVMGVSILESPKRWSGPWMEDDSRGCKPNFFL